MSDKVNDDVDADNNSEEVANASEDDKIKDLVMYSAEELMDLRTVYWSSKWPDYLDESFKNNRGIWDPDRWHQNKKRGSTPPAEDKPDKEVKEKPEGAANKKRDIKDRLFMAETEGIVLSPQRRSFITGCQVSKAPEGKDASGPEGAGQTTNSNQKSDMRADPISNSNRRVGSGRIISRDRAAPPPAGDDFNSRDSADRYGFRDRRDNWYQQDRDYDGNSRGGGRGAIRPGVGGRGGMRPEGNQNARKGSSRYRDSEPEWMSAPVNQDDMMELKGFDDSPEKEAPKLEKAESEGSKAPEAKKKMPKNFSAAPSDAFNIDDILHMDVIPGLANILDDGDPVAPMVNEAAPKISGAAPVGGSRFSQFFSKPQEPQQQQPRRSSIVDELGANSTEFMQKLIRSQAEAAEQESHTSIKIPIPGDPSACFAPISPAAKTGSVPVNSLMEMLRSGGNNREENMPALPQLKGDVKTAEELEANIEHSVGLQRDEFGHEQQRHHRKLSPQQQQQQQPPEGEMSAFKKFAALVNKGNSDHQPQQHHRNGSRQFEEMNPQHHQQPQQFHDRGGHGMRSGPVIRPSPIPANAPTEQEILAELAFREQHQQLRMPPPGSTIQPSREDVLLMAAQRRLIPELLKTQEAISLQTAVQNGGMSMLNTLLYQFVYGQMEPTRREILLQVIKFYQLKGYFGPQYAAVPPQPQMAHLGLHGHHLSQHSGGPESSGISPTSPTPGNTLAVSPIPGRDRVPSPQEIAIHAQQIMQNALIKRKLEEQKENYRRRQEQDQLRKATDSPSLAFTPTVVMKKMAADRRDSDPKPVIPELKVSTSEKIAMQNLVGHNPMPPRTSPGSPRMGMVHSQQQQLLFMQQQIRAQQQMAAMQAGHNVDPRLLMQAQAMMQQQQQSQHQVPNHPRFMGHGPQLGFDQQQNQHQPSQQGGLSRFFSPEVLAQAQSGNAPPLPPLPTQKAMTLEEIERQAAAVRI